MCNSGATWRIRVILLQIAIYRKVTQLGLAQAYMYLMGCLHDPANVQQMYSKLVNYLFDIDSFRVRRNKSGEVWSSNLGDLDVESYPPKVHISEDHISAPMGCCAPKFLHALENDQVLLAHPHRERGPPYNFFPKGGVKNWLKM